MLPLAWIFPDSPVVMVPYMAFVIMPDVLVLVTGFLTLWGVSLVCLGMKEKESVVAISLATIASSLPFLLLVGLFLFVAY
jgi:hypothetical protein